MGFINKYNWGYSINLFNQSFFFKAENLKYQMYCNSLALLKHLKNKYRKKRCFIIGNAPSLNEMDLSLLNKEYTFTVNKGYKLADMGLNHSVFHVIADPNTWLDVMDEYDLNYAQYTFLRSDLKKNFKSYDKNVVIYNFYKDKMMYDNATNFQTDIKYPLYRGSSVVLDALQIAVYSGFSEIYFIGVDLTFNIDNWHFYTSTNRELEGFNKMPVPSVLQAFKNADSYLDTVKLYNAGIGGNLDVIKRVNYNSLFDKVDNIK